MSLRSEEEHQRSQPAEYQDRRGQVACQYKKAVDPLRGAQKLRLHPGLPEVVKALRMSGCPAPDLPTAYLPRLRRLLVTFCTIHVGDLPSLHEQAECQVGVLR